MQLLRRIEMEYSPWKIRFSSDNSRLLLISREGISSCRIDGKMEGVFIQPLIAFDAAFINDRLIVAAFMSQEQLSGLALYDLQTGRALTELQAGEGAGAARSVCVDLNRGRIYAGILEGTGTDEIGIYDLSLAPQSSFKLPYLHMPFDVAISRSGDRLMIAGVFFGVWDVSAEPKLISEECPQESDCTGTPCEVNSGNMTPDGRFAVASIHGAKGSCFVMNAETGRLINWYGPAWDFFASAESGPGPAAISPDGNYVAVAEIPETTVKVYRVSDGTVFREYPVKNCGALAFSPAGGILAIGRDAGVDLWQLDS